MNAQFTFSRVATSLALMTLAGSAFADQAGTVKEVISGQTQSSTQTGSRQNRHCVIRLDPVTQGQKESASQHIGCYPTFAAATYAGTNGTVSLAPDATPQSLKDSDLASSAYRLIGVDYEYAYYLGSSLSWYARNSWGCYFGYSYIANMPSSWNNRLSSTTSYGGCYYNYNYDYYDQQGDYAICFGNCFYIGTRMDNDTSSKRWRGR